jgi:hypothetical protein
LKAQAKEKISTLDQNIPMAVKKTTPKKKPTAKKPVAKKTQPVAKKVGKKVAPPAKAKPAAKKPVKPKKAVNKTQATKGSVKDFINSVPDEQKRKDSWMIIDLMKKVTKAEPVMWGASIIGFGNVTITSPSGRVVDWLVMGFSPRKANITLYLGVSAEKYAADLKKLGKHKTGGGCIYINKLADVDLKVLEAMIAKGGFK